MPDRDTYAEQWTAAANVLRAHADKFDEVAKTAPAAPRVRRSGALMECGCWWYAFPGSSVGHTRQECPLHGYTVMAKANVEEPTSVWIPLVGGDS